MELVLTPGDLRKLMASLLPAGLHCQECVPSEDTVTIKLDVHLRQLGVPALIAAVAPSAWTGIVHVSWSAAEAGVVRLHLVRAAPAGSMASAILGGLERFVHLPIQGWLFGLMVERLKGKPWLQLDSESRTVVVLFRSVPWPLNLQPTLSLLKVTVDGLRVAGTL